MSQQEVRAATPVQKTEYTPPAEGTYNMEIRDIGELPSKFSAGDFQYQFKADIWPTDGDSVSFMFWCTKKYVFGSKASNLAKWVSGAIGSDAARAKETFEPIEWIDRPLQVKIYHKEKLGEDGVTVEGYAAKVSTWMSPTKAHAEQAIQKAELAAAPVEL